MISKKQIIKTVEKSVKESFTKGIIDPVKVNRFLKIYSSSSKQEAIEFISPYLKGVKRELSRQTLHIESAIALSITDLNRIEKKVKAIHQISKVETVVNPGLLGGIKIKIADEIYEATSERNIADLRSFIAKGV